MQTEELIRQGMRISLNDPEFGKVVVKILRVFDCSVEGTKKVSYRVFDALETHGTWTNSLKETAEWLKESGAKRHWTHGA